MTNEVDLSTESRVYRHRGDYTWEGVPRSQYKESGPHWRGVSRTELIAETPTAGLPFHVRYFEIEPGGFSSCERHQHEHVVMVCRGEGTVLLDGSSKKIGPGDVVHVRSGSVHQFRCEPGSEPLGFYCIVAADRDRPEVLDGGASSCEWSPRDESTSAS